MNYCEKCHVAAERCCPLCGTKKLRGIQDEDFCFLTGNSAAYCDMLEDIFKENDIPYAALPYGSGLEARLALPLQNRRLYVPFASLEAAKEIIRQIENSETESLRKALLQYADELNISPKLEKKLRKKLKLREDEIFEYCVGIIESANKIVDNGRITDCSEGGHYLFCFSEKATLSINSATYEILSVTK